MRILDLLEMEIVFATILIEKIILTRKKIILAIVLIMSIYILFGNS
jgi:hypothetical protein